MHCNTFRQLLRPTWRQLYRPVLSVGYSQQGGEGGPVDWASQVLQIIALACTLERSLQCRLQRQHNAGRRQLPVKSPELIGVSSGAWGRLLSVGGTIVVPLASYRPPLAGQPPASKVLARHSPPTPVGAWSVGQKPKHGLQPLHQAKTRETSRQR